MSTRVGLVHTTINAVEPMSNALRQHAPQLEQVHFLDEGFVIALRASGGLNEELEAGFTRLVGRAVETGVAGVLLSCSSFSPLVPRLDKTFPVPVVSVDGAMLVKALAGGSRIGVVATVPSALETTTELLKGRARELGTNASIDGRLADGAFDALQAGDGDGHDRRVKEAAQALAAGSDIIVLAQISMARAAPSLRDLPVPVLTSADTSVHALLERLQPWEGSAGA